MRGIIGEDRFTAVGQVAGDGELSPGGSPGWVELSDGSFYGAQTARPPFPPYVEGSLTGLYGTSFAAPIVAGYAAIVGSKFLDATPTQIVNQLLSTARQDTLLNFTPGIFGQGEACLACALSPITIQ